MVSPPFPFSNLCWTSSNRRKSKACDGLNEWIDTTERMKKRRGSFNLGIFYWRKWWANLTFLQSIPFSTHCLFGLSLSTRADRKASSSTPDQTNIYSYTSFMFCMLPCGSWEFSFLLCLRDGFHGLRGMPHGEQPALHSPVAPMVHFNQPCFRWIRICAINRARVAGSLDLPLKQVLTSLHLLQSQLWLTVEIRTACSTISVVIADVYYCALIFWSSRLFIVEWNVNARDSAKMAGSSSRALAYKLNSVISCIG